MKLNVHEYYLKMTEYYYSEPWKYTPENDFDITPEEMVLINTIWHWHTKTNGNPNVHMDSESFSEYSYYNPYYLEWIASTNKELKPKEDVDWTKVLNDKRGKRTECFANGYCNVEQPWWTTDKYKDLYEKHRMDIKAIYYREAKEEEHRKAENKAAQFIRRCKKKAKKDFENGK